MLFEAMFGRSAEEFDWGPCLMFGSTTFEFMLPVIGRDWLMMRGVVTIIWGG